ncbi:hypothetical protein Pcinc_004532 [Petrolisthes cinctipes]|uniref:Uncharacterized protein n=1 Tax=Petrolisthes cinctipes TaxID=88211 RepID=A0AAE1GF61_PETCI|nr:hypothetical protein Pcinc_004532 [Petrolisthes cinctipes]
MKDKRSASTETRKIEMSRLMNTDLRNEDVVKKIAHTEKSVPEGIKCYEGINQVGDRNRRCLHTGASTLEEVETQQASEQESDENFDVPLPSPAAVS